MLSLVNYSDDEGDSDISDDEAGSSVAVPVSQTKTAAPSSRLGLPQPKSQTFDPQTAEDNHINTKKEQNGTSGVDEITERTIELKLPTPKAETKDKIVVEEDDEFLRKKAVPSIKPPPKPKMPVRIMVPSLLEFANDEVPKEKKVMKVGPAKGSGLLGMLPRPKIDTFMPDPAKPGTSQSDKKVESVKKVTALVPDSVKRAQALKRKKETEDSDSGSDTETDFFSLDKKDKLPEISSNEIALMVAQRAAKIAEAKTKFDTETSLQVDEEPEFAAPCEPLKLEDDNLQKLTGGNRAKRSKVEQGVEFIDISDADLKPSTQDFLRSQLAQQTQFVPTGKLIGYDSTNKRKSQITYLAQKALANEQELQALWSSNRNKQRASSSKYGF